MMNPDSRSVSNPLQVLVTGTLQCIATSVLVGGGVAVVFGLLAAVAGSALPG